MRDPRRLERALRRVAERRIREAIATGAFDDLPGAGRPIRGIDEPYDPLWWVKGWLRRERLAEVLRGNRRTAVAAVEELRTRRADRER